MDKIKQVFSPGSSKDDDLMYGDGDARKSEQSKSDSSQNVQGHTITQQVLNPGGDKYDQQRFGSTETPPTVASDAKLVTDEPKKEHSVLRQIINPGGDKYDNQAYGSTAHGVGEEEHKASMSDPTTQPDHSISRQIFNPGHDKYDPVVHGTAEHQAMSGSSQPTSSVAGVSQPRAQNESGTPGSALSVKSGVEGPYARQADTSLPGMGSSMSTAQPAQQTLPDRSAQTATNDPNIGRDAAIAGGVGMAGAGTYAAAQHESSSKMADRPHPLGGLSKDDTHINPISAPEPVERQADSGSAVTGGTTLGGAGLGTYNSDPDGALGTGPLDGQTSAGAYSGEQLNQAPDDVRNATYTDRSYAMGPNSAGAVDTTQTTGQSSALHPGGQEYPMQTASGSMPSDSGPASKTIGPHESNMANIVDPRVQPVPSQMKESKTTGPYQSDLANKMDPRVESDPAKIAAQKVSKDHAESSSGIEDKHSKEEAEEKKPSLLQRILHPGQNKSEHSDEKPADGSGPNKLQKKAPE